MSHLVVFIVTQTLMAAFTKIFSFHVFINELQKILLMEKTTSAQSLFVKIGLKRRFVPPILVF